MCLIKVIATCSKQAGNLFFQAISRFSLSFFSHLSIKLAEVRLLNALNCCIVRKPECVVYSMSGNAKYGGNVCKDINEYWPAPHYELNSFLYCSVWWSTKKPGKGSEVTRRGLIQACGFRMRTGTVSSGAWKMGWHLACSGQCMDKRAWNRLPKG